MIFTTGFFVSAVATTLTGLIYLAAKLQQENNKYIEEIQFFLKHKTIAHNKVKAQLAVMKSRYSKLEKENHQLKKDRNIKETVEFSGLLGQAEFVEVRNQRIAQLESEINDLKQMSIRDFS